jgi:hypothetical protein
MAPDGVREVNGAPVISAPTGGWTRTRTPRTRTRTRTSEKQRTSY